MKFLKLTTSEKDDLQVWIKTSEIIAVAQKTKATCIFTTAHSFEVREPISDILNEVLMENIKKASSVVKDEYSAEYKKPTLKKRRGRPSKKIKTLTASSSVPSANPPLPLTEEELLKKLNIVPPSIGN